MSEPERAVEYEVNGHEYQRVAVHEGDYSYKCTKCRNVQLVFADDDDPVDTLELMSPEQCKRVVINHPTDHRDGLAVILGMDGAVTIERFGPNGERASSIKLYANERDELAFAVSDIESPEVW